MALLLLTEGWIRALGLKANVPFVCWPKDFQFL